MPIQRDGKIYYTQEEVDVHIHASIRKNAQDAYQKIQKMKSESEIPNGIVYV